MFNGEGQNFIKMHYYVQIMTLLYLHIQPLSGKGFQQDAKRKEDPVHVVPSRLPFHHETRRSRLIRNLLKDGSNRISQSVISWRGPSSLTTRGCIWTMEDRLSGWWWLGLRGAGMRSGGFSVRTNADK